MQIYLTTNETLPCSPLAPAGNSTDMQPIVLGLHWIRGPKCQLLGEGNARGDRAGALPSGKAHFYHHGQGLEGVLKTNLPYFPLQPLLVAVGDERRQLVGLIAVEDGVNGVVTGNVLYLTAAEIVAGG